VEEADRKMSKPEESLGHPLAREDSRSTLLAPLDPGTVPDQQLTDCLSGAGAMFVNIRVPAALCAGSSLASLFIFFKPGSHEEVSLVETLYTLLAGLSVTFELGTIFVATATGVKLTSRSGVNPMAPDVMTFLVREAEFSYLFVRLHFFLGLELLIMSMATRACMLVRPLSLGVATALFLVAMAATMLAVFQTTTAPHYRGIFHMLGRYVVVLFTDLFRAQPCFGAIAIASMVAALCFGVNAVMELTSGQ